MDKSLTNVSFRVDTEIKNQAEKLFADLGLNMTTAFNMFLRQAVREGSIPFRITLNTPNDQTREAIAEVQAMKKDPNKRLYASFDELLKEVTADV